MVPQDRMTAAASAVMRHLLSGLKATGLFRTQLLLDWADLGGFRDFRVDADSEIALRLG